ncbi:MAG: type III secretion chaperone [Parachlamydiales bacterium]|jgi:predicted Zn-dependent protease
MDWQNYLELSDESLQDLRSVGYLYIKQGCYNIALEIFVALTILSPGNSYDLQTLGALFLHQEKYIKAIDYLNKASKIDPSNYLIILNKAKALLSLGYRTEGIALANSIIKSSNQKLAQQASALISAYS